MKNSFKELENAQVRLFDHQRQKRVLNRVEGTLDTLRMFGRIFEMYVPVLGDTLITLGGKDGPAPPEAEESEVPSPDDDGPSGGDAGNSELPDDEPPKGPDFTIDDPSTR